MVSSYVCEKHHMLMMAQVCPECLKALVEAYVRLLDICTFVTPSLIYKFLGDDAAVAAGLPLWPEHYSGDPSMQLDLSWAEAAATPFKEATNAL